MRLGTIQLTFCIIFVALTVYAVNRGYIRIEAHNQTPEAKILAPDAGDEILTTAIWAPTSGPSADETVPASTEVVQMKVTAYCPCSLCCGKWADGKTATNRDAYATRGVAADPRLLPYGTRLYIPEAGEFTVDDTGGAMRQSAKNGVYHLDLRFSSHQEARQWGVKWLDVKIIR